MHVLTQSRCAHATTHMYVALSIMPFLFSRVYLTNREKGNKVRGMFPLASFLGLVWILLDQTLLGQSGRGLVLEQGNVGTIAVLLLKTNYIYLDYSKNQDSG